MDVSSLLAVNGAPAKPKASQAGNADSEDFARLLEQSSNAAKGQDRQDNSVAGKTADNALTPASSDVDVLGELSGEAADAANPTNALAIGLTPPPDAAPARLTPLTQGIARSVAAQLAPPATAPGIDDTAISSGAATALGDGELSAFDLGAIRERLATIANAQRGGEVSPTLAQASAGINGQLQDSARNVLDLAKPAGSHAADLGLQALQADGTTRHQQLAQGLQQAVATRAGDTPPPTAQPATLLDSVTATPVTPLDMPVEGHRGSENAGGQGQAFAGSLGATSASTATGPMQQAANAPAQSLNAPLASPQWQQGLGQQLVALHQRGDQRMELHLRPAELGPLTVSLKVDDQLAQAQFFSTNPQVRAAVEQAIPQLREALGENGIQLGEAMVGEQRHNGHGENHSQGGSTPATDSDLAVASSGGHDDTATTLRPLASEGHGVDLYA